MEPKDLSLELKELREVIISSNLTTCYLLLEELLSVKEETIHYQEFSEHWIDTYKDVYRLIAKMKAG
jgi:hypothetical protein